MSTIPSHFLSKKSNNLKCIQVGNRTLIIGKTLQQLQDSTILYKKQLYKELRQRLEDDGVILVRQVIPTTIVNSARNELLKHLCTKPNAIKEGTHYLQAQIGVDKETNKLNAGYTVDAESGGQPDAREADNSIKGWYSVGNCEAVKAVYDGQALKQFYANLFDGDFTNFPGCTW
jgi:hypothetical protein